MSPEPIPPNGIGTALVSIGGSPAPILFTLRRERPVRVWYFCSPGSREVADALHRQLDWHPDRDFIEVERFEELGPCYRALREAIPGLLAKWRVDPADVLVDYTGGTKTMSAALLLAATEFFERFAYVGGHQRQKDGLGITVDGSERRLTRVNRWSGAPRRNDLRARGLMANGTPPKAPRVQHQRVFKALRNQVVVADVL